MTTATGTFASSELESVPETLDTAQSKLVYITIRSAGRATVEDLSAALNMQKITLLDVLSTLTDRNLIERKNGRYAPT